MSEPTIEEVVDMAYWKSVRCGQLDSTNRVLGAATALMAVLRDLEKSSDASRYYSYQVVDHVMDRIRAAVGDEK